jgi:nitrite reductase/ring-hydroxylating ferredoxin subunit
VGVDTTVFDAGPDDWTATGVRESDLGEGEPRCALVDGVPVLLVRDGGRLHALHNRCTHRGGSLAEGEVADGTVTCPLHGSVFALDDGAVRQGPAAYPQPLFEARPGAGGEIEVRRSAR